ncbi:MAG: PEGA domain-containing protein [Deltaproteobacteria bacterium]|nr:PEGA domain-containing protein [Deltaproteobacteria bacterium]
MSSSWGERSGRRGAGWGLAACLAWTAVAQGQPADPADDEARAHFTQGVDAYETGDFVTALREFRRAYELRPTAGLRYNLGAALYKTGQLVEARTELTQYLSQSDPGRITPERRREVDELLALIDGAVGLVELSAVVDGAQVTVDGLPAGTTPLADPLAMLPGSHDLGVEAAGYEPYRVQVTVSAGERRQLAATLVAVVVPIGPPEGPVEGPVEPESPDEEGGVSSAWFWSAVGVAGALAVGGAITGGLVLSKQSDFDSAVDRWHSGDSSAYADGQSLAADGDDLGVATTALFVAAGAAAAAAVVLVFFTDFGGEGPQEAESAAAWAPVVGVAPGESPGLALGAVVRF